MADLIVTFSRAVQTVPSGVSLPLPLAVGRHCVTELLSINSDTDPDVTDAAATEDDYLVELLAEADCWVAIGESPAAAIGGESCRKLKANVPREFWVLPGDKVAVTAA